MKMLWLREDKEAIKVKSSLFKEGDSATGHSARDRPSK